MVVLICVLVAVEASGYSSHSAYPRQYKGNQAQSGGYSSDSGSYSSSNSDSYSPVPAYKSSNNGPYHSYAVKPALYGGYSLYTYRGYARHPIYKPGRPSKGYSKKSNSRYQLRPVKAVALAPAYPKSAARAPRYPAAAAYSAPSYKAPSYGPPSYSPPSYPSYKAPSYSRPSYSPPSYKAPSYGPPSYSPPSYSPPSYPSYKVPSYGPPSYSPASYRAPSYSKPSYSPPSYEQPRPSSYKQSVNRYRSQPTRSYGSGAPYSSAATGY